MTELSRLLRENSFSGLDIDNMARILITRECMKIVAKQN